MLYRDFETDFGQNETVTIHLDRYEHLRSYGPVLKDLRSELSSKNESLFLLLDKLKKDWGLEAYMEDHPERGTEWVIQLPVANGIPPVWRQVSAEEKPQTPPPTPEK